MIIKSARPAGQPRELERSNRPPHQPGCLPHGIAGNPGIRACWFGGHLVPRFQEAAGSRLNQQEGCRRYRKSGAVQGLNPGGFFRAGARLLACVAAAAALTGVPANFAKNLQQPILLYTADHQSLESFYNLPWSETRRARLEKFDSSRLKRLDRIDFDSLDQPAKVDYLLLKSKLRREKSWLEFERRQFDPIKELIPGKEAIENLELHSWHLEPLNLERAAEQLSHIPPEIKKLRERLEAGRKKEKTPPDALRISPVLAVRAASVIGDLRGVLQRWFEFYASSQPGFTWWMEKPHDSLSSALADYEKYLREEIAGIKGKDEDPLIGESIGSQMLEKELAAEWIPYTPAELLEIAQKEFAWCQEQMKAASQEMGCGVDWKKALGKVKADFAPPGQQKDLVSEMAHEAINFVKAKDLVTIPPLCAETWRVSMISSEGQKTLPFAAYSHQHMMVAYATGDMSNEDKLMSMRGNNRHFTRIVAAHELIPGHHLQIFQAARHRPYRAIFSTPFLVEGWALYWEMRLWDLGYARSPEDRIGMLFWRMHRAARIIVSLKFHLGEMTPPQMVDFLVDQVGHERFGATSEVRRFIGGAYSPLYQCAYMIGGLQLRALHDEITGKHQMSEKQFHDAVLRENAIPVEMIRADLLKLPLEKTSRPSWRFYPGL